jgi:hypothetical protein
MNDGLVIHVDDIDISYTMPGKWLAWVLPVSGYTGAINQNAELPTGLDIAMQRLLELHHHESPTRQAR